MLDTLFLLTANRCAAWIGVPLAVGEARGLGREPSPGRLGVRLPAAYTACTSRLVAMSPTGILDVEKPVTGPDTVEVRALNGGDAAVSVPAGVWTVAYGRGANGVLLPPAA